MVFNVHETKSDSMIVRVLFEIMLNQLLFSSCCWHSATVRVPALVIIIYKKEKILISDSLFIIILLYNSYYY